MLPRQKKAQRAVLSAVAVTVVSVLVALLARWPAITRDLTVAGEGQLGVRYWEVARNAIARGQGFPLWDRALCGGLPFLGNPDTQLLSSLFAGVFRVHGDTMARWYPTVFAGLAVAGTILWCRTLKLSWVASIFAGALFASSGFLGMHGAVRAPFVPLALIPWVLYFARIGERDLRAAAGAGAVLAVMLLEGGLFPFCFALVAMFLTMVPRVFSPDAGASVVLRVAGIAAVVCLLLGGIKLVPVLVQLARAPRLIHELDAGPWTDLIPMLGDSDRGGMPGRRYHVNEFRGYLGPFAFGMAIAGAGAALILKPRRVGLVLLLLGSAVLTRGSFADYAPWTLLTKLPPFNQLQVPSRFVGLVDLAVAAAAAVALDVALRAVKRPLLQVPLLLVALIAVYDPIAAGRKVLVANITAPSLPRPDPQPQRFHLVAEDFGPMATLAARNLGIAACQKPWPYPEASGFAIGDVPQATLDGGTVTAVDVRQNATLIDATAAQPSVLHLNQTWDQDFVASVGEIRRSPRGTLDVALPAGTHHVAIRYRPRGLLPGMIATALGALTLIGAFVAQRRIASRQR